MATVLHLIPKSAWDQLAETQAVSNESLSTDGFIHCTDDPLVMLGVANAFYTQQAGDFVVLHVDVERLSSPCIWEEPAHPEGRTDVVPLAKSFPHVYGPIDRAAVVAVYAVQRDSQGNFVGYEPAPQDP